MGNVIMEATQINYRRDDTLKTVDQKLQELSQESAIDTDIAPVFKSTETYNPGDLVYYRNKLYKCLNTHTGAWAAGDFASTDVSTAINAAVGALDAIKADASNIAPAFDATASYEIGDLVYYGGTIYRCINDHTGDWDAEDFSATAIDVELSELNSNLTELNKHNGGTSVDISGATLSEKYTFPSDGYIYVSSESDTSGTNKCAVVGGNGTTLAYIYQPIYAASDIRSLYVRKGMQFYVVQKSANSAMRFTPFT